MSQTATFRVALFTENACEFTPLAESTQWCAENAIEFPLVLEAGSAVGRKRFSRIRRQTKFQAKLNGTSWAHQFVSTLIFRKWIATPDPGGPRPPNVVKVPAVNDPAVARAVRDANVDVVITISVGILTKKTIEAIGVPIYNVHDGDPSLFRGRPSFIWDIVDDRDETTIVVHELQPSVDSGAVIESITLPIVWHRGLRQTMLSCEDQAFPARFELLKSALEQLSAGTHQRIEPTPGPLRTLPTTKHLRLAARRCRHEASNDSR